MGHVHTLPTWNVLTRKPYPGQGFYSLKGWGIWARFLEPGTAQSSDPDQALMSWFLNANQDFSSSLNGIKSGNKLKTKTKTKQKTRKTKELKKETNLKKRFFKRVCKLMWLALSLSQRGYVPTAVSLPINPILVLNSRMLWRHAIVSHISKSVNLLDCRSGVPKRKFDGYPITSPPPTMVGQHGFPCTSGGLRRVEE